MLRCRRTCRHPDKRRQRQKMRKLVRQGFFRPFVFPEFEFVRTDWDTDIFDTLVRAFQVPSRLVLEDPPLSGYARELPFTRLYGDPRFSPKEVNALSVESVQGLPIDTSALATGVSLELAGYVYKVESFDTLRSVWELRFLGRGFVTEISVPYDIWA